MNIAVILFVAFIIKHFIVDFPLQTKWMTENKHLFGHPGGITHAALHGITTAIIVWAFLPPGSYVLATALGLLDTVVHYLTDYSKMNIGQRLNATPDTKIFWFLIGLDQMIHYLTYAAIIRVVIGVII